MDRIGIFEREEDARLLAEMVGGEVELCPSPQDQTLWGVWANISEKELQEELRYRRRVLEDTLRKKLRTLPVEEGLVLVARLMKIIW